MNESKSKSSKVVHWTVVVLLFLMIIQPTVDNTKALLTGSLVMGELSIEVTFSKMVLHIFAMLIGWVGFWLFLQRRRLGAYVSIVAHSLGLTAAITQTPELLEAIPTAALAVFFVVLFAITLVPIRVYASEYS